MSTSAPLAYTTLDAVKALLLTTTVKPARDEVLEQIILEVSQQISDGLGVVWDGEQAPSVIRPATVDYLTRTAVFDLPAIFVTDVLVGETPMYEGDWAPGFMDDQGRYRGLIVHRAVSSLGGAPGRVDIVGTWADRPGGDVPIRVQRFATWAVKQRWQIEEAGSTTQRGLDGLVTTFAEEPFDERKGKRWHQLRQDFRVRRTPRT